MPWSRVALAAAAAVALSCAGGSGASGAYGSYGAYPPPGAYPSNPPLQGAGFPTTESAASPGCGRAPAKIGASALHVNALGRDRAYTLVVPEGYDAKAPYPLVFVLHGSGGNAAGARAQTDLEKLAAGHAVFVYPDAGGSWDLDAPASSNRDVALFDAILVSVHNALCIDPRRVFVTGFSNGAYMANQLACKRGERIRGVVTHAGGGPYETSGGSYDATGHLACPGKAVASLVVHGNSDGSVPPSEGQKSIDHWSYANRCGSGTTSTLTPPCVTLEACFQPVSVCRIPGLGHGLWSQAGKVTWAFIDALK
ncbi:MAG: polyhydroxybutyrate depolymerase [Myxococcales bacterium]|nr:polyhydroxybutyrate depolymerase [Myxococcales bacterium]